MATTLANCYINCYTTRIKQRLQKEAFTMAIIRKMIYKNEPLTAQQLKQIEEAEKKPIVFAEDCPELTDKQLRKIAAMAAQQRAERRQRSTPTAIYTKTKTAN